jgi:hypothetical protein
MLNTRTSMMEDFEMPSELPANPLDHSSHHATSHSTGNEDSGSTTHQDATVEIDQPGETANVQGAGKTKNGGYGYYVVCDQGNW